MNSINHHLHHHLDIHNQSKIAANRVIETKLSKTNSNSHHLNDHRESPPSSASSSPSWTLKSNQYQRNGAQSTPTWSSMAPVSEDPMDFIKFLCRCFCISDDHSFGFDVLHGRRSSVPFDSVSDHIRFDLNVLFGLYSSPPFSCCYGPNFESIFTSFKLHQAPTINHQWMGD
ncbi:hypothetical protein QR98_0017740 [Sarcoptes scabiei]|uniref:Uncharacterized protein n=1 Tax=Sarcoptes scabiei TaxID=52283 RepID=A0A131ZXD1_SARSC|nr:hypothetical protein QR98_0017740 [Sarcoptes scabiei]